LVTDKAAALKALRRSSAGSAACVFEGDVPGKDVSRLLIESMVAVLRYTVNNEDRGQRGVRDDANLLRRLDLTL
jgi:hypothetical protein